MGSELRPQVQVLKPMDSASWCPMHTIPPWSLRLPQHRGHVGTVPRPTLPEADIKDTKLLRSHLQAQLSRWQAGFGGVCCYL